MSHTVLDFYNSAAVEVFFFSLECLDDLVLLPEVQGLVLPRVPLLLGPDPLPHLSSRHVQVQLRMLLRRRAIWNQMMGTYPGAIEQIVPFLQFCFLV